MGGGDCPMDNDLVIAPFLPFPASFADIPSSFHSHPPPCQPLYNLHKLKCEFNIKHKYKPCKKLKLKLKHEYIHIPIGHQFHLHHSHSQHAHQPRHHQHHDHVHNKHHHHHGNHHPFGAHPMTVQMAMIGPPPHHH